MPAKHTPKNKTLGVVKRKLSGRDLDALLLYGESDIRYLSGFYTEGAFLLVSRKGETVYATDPMNLSLVKKGVARKGINVISGPKGSIQAVISEIKARKLKKIGINGLDMPLLVYESLKKALPGVCFIDRKGKTSSISILRDIRAIKSPSEIKILREAAKETVKIWRYARRNIRAGMTEKDIATLLDVTIRKRGYDNSFPTIAAIGANTAYPHAIPGEKRLKSGEHVLVDFGIRINGYCSDLTRTCVEGRIDRQIRVLRNSVHKAQNFAIGMVKPGVLIRELVESTNIIFKRDNLKEYVLHGLGHGVGLDIHELPTLSHRSDVVLREGMIITIEPGLYKEGVGGVRREDMVLVTKKGCEVLTV